ncbi:hypothetical protein C3473_17050 [Mycobacterium kansasii]|nr:hypothetical protein C3475_27155 [Mycobacterium kansasii]POX76632.1 hypothetical protein C3470_23675 [Mycobacterium kansasii]POX77054.1 hypothetical protein C3471_19225 [Mycobacterium kansasii]POX93437.1 hypothetical protein C3473_17050 [Mycobacterium kansasii]POY02383.1 hypothetical protein C3474_27010 [Mycobacterium kansasii]
MRRGEDGHLQAFRQAGGDQRDRGAAASRGYGGQGDPKPVALQYLFDKADEPVQRGGDQLLKIVARQPNRLAGAGGNGCRRQGRQLLFGGPASAEETRHRPHAGGGARHLRAVDIGGHSEQVAQDKLVDFVAGELAVPNRRADLAEIRTGVGQGYARTPGAEVAQRDDPTRRASGPGVQRRQRGRGIGDHRRRHAVGRQCGLAAQCSPQCGELAFGPVGRSRDGDRGAVADGSCHGVECFHREGLALMPGPVGRHQRGRVADPFDKTAQHQSRLGHARVLFWQAHFGCPMLEQP